MMLTFSLARPACFCMDFASMMPLFSDIQKIKSCKQKQNNKRGSNEAAMRDVYALLTFRNIYIYIYSIRFDLAHLNTLQNRGNANGRVLLPFSGKF